MQRMIQKMKACLIVFLAGLFLIPSGFSIANAQAIEYLSVDITFDGVYALFEEHNFQICVPKAWIEYEPSDDCYFMLGTADQSQFMWMSIYQSQDYSMDSLLDELMDNPEYRYVFGTYFNSIPFVCFEAIDTGVFGAVTLSGDGSYMYFFHFYPVGDALLGNLAVQIMASISLIAP